MSVVETLTGPATEAAWAESIADHARRNEANPAFRADWNGLSVRDVRLRAQAQVAFVELLRQATGWDDLAGRRILDLGCGNGRWLRWMLELGARPDDLVGIDVTDGRFAEAEAINPNIHLLHGHRLALPFRSGQFDLVTQFVCFSSIPTADLRAYVAAEVDRVLRPAGWVFWWDLPSAVAPGHAGERLDPADLWPGRPLARRHVGPCPKPSECLRPINKVRTLVTPLVDRLGHPPTHLAAVVGPKP